MWYCVYDTNNYFSRNWELTVLRKIFENVNLKYIQTIMLHYNRKTGGNHLGGEIFPTRNLASDGQLNEKKKELIMYLKRSLVIKWERPGLAHKMAPTHWIYLQEAMCACDAVTTLSHERMAVTLSSVWVSCVEHSRYNSSTTESTPLLSPSGRNKQLFRIIQNFYSLAEKI